MVGQFCTRRGKAAPYTHWSALVIMVTSPVALLFCLLHKYYYGGLRATVLAHITLTIVALLLNRMMYCISGVTDCPFTSGGIKTTVTLAIAAAILLRLCCKQEPISVILHFKHEYDAPVAGVECNVVEGLDRPTSS